MLTIRDARPEELDAIRAMNQAAQPAVSDLPREELDWFAREAPYLRVADVDGRLAGFLIGLVPGAAYDSENYAYFEANWDSWAYVDRIVVADGFRGAGVGQAFYADFERFARERGAVRITCEVNTRPRNETSLRFHARAGFREVGTQDTEGGKKTVSLLVKDLD
ncbi:MAG: GNAT family N-acetyltransferase [bacterium]